MTAKVIDIMPRRPGAWTVGTPVDGDIVYAIGTGEFEILGSVVAAPAYIGKAARTLGIKAPVNGDPSMRDVASPLPDQVYKEAFG